ncbi:MAG: D-glycero-beta-D-manno-heptose 1,7-bisphosphate 7-phosphatase [Desulfobacterales bacterium]
MKKTVFLDRDGVINKDSPDYIKNWGEFEFLPGSVEAIRRLTEKGFDIILITNQSGIGRGIIAPNDLEHMHLMMQEKIREAGGKIQDIFFCPHRPDENCECRKPRPGLIWHAQKKYGIDLASAWMIGDSAKDMECAVNAGCGRHILVQTGNGTEAEKALAEKGIRPTYVEKNLLTAAERIIARSRSSPDSEV